MASGSLGPVRRRSGFHAPGTATSQRGFRIADGGARSDHARGPTQALPLLSRVGQTSTHTLAQDFPLELREHREANPPSRAQTAALHASQVWKLYRAGVSKAEIARR